MKRITFILFFILMVAVCYGQDSVNVNYGSLKFEGAEFSALKQDSLNKKKLTGLLVSEGVIYAGAMTGLYFAWYDGYPQSAFHFFNDGNEWCGMDKAGHAFSTYNLSRWAYQGLKWSGVGEKKAIWYGALTGWGFLLTIEVFDGFSSQWGFSAYDLLANTLGTGLFLGQQLLWNQQRFMLKYSYHPTQYASIRPDLLGDNFALRCLKDYNGMTIWLSGNIHSFLNEDSRFPRWLNVSFGYGAEGMIGGVDNPVTDKNGNFYPKFQRYHQFYLSLDVDLTKIKTKSKVLKTVFSILNCIKIPAPALEFNTRKGGGPNVVVHPIYF